MCAYEIGLRNSTSQASRSVQDKWLRQTKYQAIPSHKNIVRLTPPLVVTEEEIKQALDIFQSCLGEMTRLKGR
jgi:acetylornithine/succinyldiaminopimelate/putrescine aminotransferase